MSDRGERLAETTVVYPGGGGAPDGASDHGGPHGSGTSGHPAPKPPRSRVFVLVFLVVACVLCVGAYGHWRTYAAAEETQRDTNSFQPTLRTTTAKVSDKPVQLTLPAQTDAFDRANIFARATGYIAERHVDIGSRVRKDDLLVRIASPDLDRQLDQAVAQLAQVQATLVQARAQVGQAEANLKLGNVTKARTDALVQRGYETFQTQDNQQANVTTQQASLDAANAGVKVAEANVQAQQATVDRLRTLAAFENVRAPFDGVVAARNVDVGDLVNADAGGSTPMFTVVSDDILRVTVHVPQSSIAGLREGLPAKVQVMEYPERPFTGRIARNSGALLSSSRTLTVEVDLDNPDHLLRAGLFVNVTFEVPRARPRVTVPSEALIFNQHGLQVAVIDQDHDVHLQPITVYRDFGGSVEISDGLRGGEQIALAPPATLEDGAKVKLRPEQGEAQAAK